MHQQAHGKRYAALLRGVNQSGKNKMPMSDLRQVFCELGFTDVETILNSGNALFSATEDDRNEMSRQITDQIRASFGYVIPVHVV